MPTVSHKRLVAIRHSQIQRARQAQFLCYLVNHDTRRGKPERVDFDRQWKGTERINQFAFIGNHQHVLGGGRNDFFTQQRTTTTLDQRQCRINLIGPINGQIQLRCFLQRCQRYAKLFAQNACAFRSRHTDNAKATGHLFR